MLKKVAASMEDAEQVETVDDDVVEVEDENGEEEAGQEGEENAEAGDDEQAEIEGEEQVEGEEAEGEGEEEDDEAEGEEGGGGEGDGDGDGEDEAAEEEDPSKKFPDPLENIGNFDAIEDPEIKTLMEKTTLKFFDGSTGLLLSRGPKYSDDKWPINCHICYESGIYTLKDLKEHLKSSRHRKMVRWRPTDIKYKHMKAFRQPFDDDDQTLTPIFIYPGEVITEITPELLDRILSRDIVPEREFAEMIGLSYGYKMKRFGKEVYECLLCRKGITVPLHFAGQKHIDRYIDLHFPNTWKKLRNMIKDGKLGWSTPLSSQQQKYIHEVIRAIYKKIEEEKGLRQPKFVNYRDFKINRFTYQKQARSKKHYDENTIEITDDMLTELLKQAHEKIGDPKKPEELEKEEKEARSRRRSATRDAGRLTSDTRKSARIIENNPQVWDRYRRMVGAILDDLEDTYQKYRKDLESHPRYKTEWKKFWHNRADELERDGIDPHNYDFNKEWIPYWEKRLSEFHAKEIIRHKFETKRKLNLSYDVRSPSPVRRKRRSSPRRRSVSPRSRHGRRRSRAPSEPRSSKRSRRGEGPVTVCSVMRLVAAIEDYLGSLGPQAVQLLSRAVLTEKSNPNPDSLLMENDYYIFFMTVKEKLKGQLQANIIEPRKISAVDRTVDQLSSIIHRFEDYRARHSGSRSNFPESNNQSNRNPSQFSGGNRGGVWHSGNYRSESGGGNNTMAQNQGFNRSIAPNNYGGNGDDGFQVGGNDYGNRGGSMNMPSGGGGNRGSNFGRMDVENNGTGSSYGGNYGGGNRGYGGSEGYGRDSGSVGGPNQSNFGSSRGKGGIGGTSSKQDMPSNRNSMPMGGNSRQSGVTPLDFGDNMNRGGGNQMSFNRGGSDTPSFGGGLSGNRPWSSGYNPPGNFNNGGDSTPQRSQYNQRNHLSKNSAEVPSGGGNYGGIGGGSNWNSGDFGGSGGNQGFNNRSHPMAPHFNRNITASRY